MAHAFERQTNSEVEPTYVSLVEPEECELFIHALAELVSAITSSKQIERDGETRSSGTSDPLFSQLGLEDVFEQPGGGAIVEPQDPVSARLFPPGYFGDDNAARDFRRFTEPELRQEKIDNAIYVRRLVEQAVEMDPPQVVLVGDDITKWLRSINDLRLTFAVQTGVGESDERGRLNNPSIRMVRQLYDFLTWWQDSLLQALNK